MLTELQAFNRRPSDMGDKQICTPYLVMFYLEISGKLGLHATQELRGLRMSRNVMNRVIIGVLERVGWGG